MKICSVTTIRASLSDTLDFVYYHLNIGIDHMFLFFDDPQDEAIEILSKEQQVTCTPCDRVHWQEHAWWGCPLEKIKDVVYAIRQKIFLARKLVCNASYLLEELQKHYAFDWVLWLDADELIYSKKSLHKVLEEVPEKFRSLHITLYEAVPEVFSYKNVFREITLFKTDAYPDIEKVKLANLNDRHHWPICSYFKGGTFGHHCIRLTGEKIHAFDPHNFYFERSIKAPSFDSLKTDQVKYLHYHCCDYERWVKKWLGKLSDKIFTQEGYSQEVLSQLFDFFQAYPDEERLKIVFERYNFLPEKHQKVLTELDLLKRIKLDPSLFRR